MTFSDIKKYLETARTSKGARIWFLIGLAIILLILWLTKVIKTGFAIGLGIVILAAIGIETFNYDLDL